MTTAAEGQKPIADQLVNIMFSTPIALKIATIIAAIQTENIKTIAPKRKSLFEQYGTSQENGDVAIQPDTEQYAKYIEEMNAFLKQEVELDCELIQMSELTEESLTPTQIYALYKNGFVS